MNLLLNDEEMKALRPDVPACGQTVFECDSCSGGCPLVAKAQLKKVVEWGDGHCSLLEHGDNAKWPIPRKHCLECWQVLLEEVK